MAASFFVSNTRSQAIIALESYQLPDCGWGVVSAALIADGVQAGNAELFD